MKALNDLIDNYERISMLCEMVSTDFVIGELKGLKKSLKPSVYKFVADWYEKHKDNLEFYIFDYISRLDQQPNSDFKDWIDDFETEPIKILMDMHRFGYNIKQEKRYIVKMKNITIDSSYLKHQLKDNHWYWGSLAESDEFSSSHTKKELEEAGFSWCFNCEGVEFEEL